MAAAFRPVNSLVPGEARPDDAMTTSPTTPRPNPPPQQVHQPPPPSLVDDRDATTPTRATFGQALASQKPLPTSPFPQAVQVPDSAEIAAKVPTRENSQHSRKSRDSEDVEMDDSDGDTAAGDDGAGSDDESVNADGTKSGKKKKSQRFYCTDYPPCNLSFTRSEHLARHIRKHTGERPFQCHCSRRFSRLDNLRQHAQTVHVNEDIPMDSLAATGARFQRQIRTDRVRQVAGRARASTAGSLGGPARGHSKSLSTSSITSVSSVGSAFSSREEIRRRPPPLVMAADPRSRLSLESYRSGGEGPYQFRPVSPTDFSTPTSATFSTGQSSPRWGSGIVSPSTSHSRSHSMYSGTRTPGRRLSVPSGANPFQSPHAAPAGRPIFAQGPMNSSNLGAFSPATSSTLASPTISTAGWSSRRDSTSTAADEAWRRRTWHPDTRNFNANTAHGNTPLFQSNPPTLPRVGESNPQTSIRLPGIESFDPLPPRPITPPRRNPSPMMVDSEPPPANPPALLPASDSSGVGDRRNVVRWDMGLHQGLTRLDITSKNSTPPRDSAGAWANEVNQAVQAQAEQVRLNPPTVRFEADPTPAYPGQNQPPSRAFHQHTVSAPITNPREMKRHGWYHGPTVLHANPRDEARADPRGVHVDRMVHPNINAFTGFPAREPEPAQLQQQQPVDRSPNPELRRLEALVAVATSEGSTATAY